MATTTWNVSKDATIARNTSTGDNWGAGKDIHMACGYVSWLPGHERGYLAFSYSFTGITAITAATLYIKTSDGYHIGSGNWNDPDLYIDLVTSSWSEGTSGADEVLGSNGGGITYSNVPSVSTTNRVTWDVNGASDPAENTFYSVDVTALVQEAFAAGTFYGLRLMSVSEVSGGDRVEFWTREKGSTHDAYLSITYTTNTAPNAPTGLTPTGDTVISGLIPTLAGTFSDPDAGDLMANAQVIVYEDDGTTVKWDSGTFAATGATFSKVYSGPALTGNTFYKWKGRTADDDGAWGAYSALQRFKANSTPNAPAISLTESPTTDVKTLTPTFNITHSDPDPSDSSMLGYRIILELTDGTAVWDSGDVAVTATVSKAVLYSGPALSWQTGYRWRARTKDVNGVWGAYSTNATFTTHTTGVPISLSPTGSQVVGSLTPTFTGSRATVDDSLTSAQIKVYASDGTTLIWDTGTFTTGVTSTAFSKIYAGTALSYSTTYKWQARVTSSVGGTSAYSALQTFITPAATTPTQTAPVGSPITTLTPTFTGAWSDTLSGIHIIIYTDAAGTVVHWDQGDVAHTVGTTYSYVYAGTALAWNTQYWWKIRVRKNSDSVWQAYTGLTSFTTDSAGVPTLDYPTANSWLGAPKVYDEYDDITSITNGTSTSSSLETGAGLFQTGIGSLKLAIASLANGNTSDSYRTVSLNMSNHGNQTPFYVYIRCSSLTNVGTVRLRFTFATSGDYAEYDVKPAAIDTWYQKSLVKGTPTATAGTVNWSNVTRIGLRVVATGGSVTSNFYLDDLKFDLTAPSFDGTTFNSEVISTYRIRVYAADQTTLVWDSGDTAGSGTTFSKLYTGSALTKGATYYWQARYVKSTGPTGNYSALRAFVLNSDPSVPTGLTPTSGSAWPDNLIPHFVSTFTDAEKDSQGDFPTYLEVEVNRNSDSVLAYRLITKTGLVAATNDIYDGLSGTVKVTGAAAPLVYETEYKYRVRYYDSKGARGTWSSYNTFKPSQSPTATISSPAHSGTVSSPSFNVTWSMSSPGSKGQGSYRVRVIRVSNSVTVIDTGRVYSSVTSYTVPSGYLVNSAQYDIEVTLYDTDSLSGVDTNRVTATWTAPDAIQNFTVTDDTTRSAMVLQWDQTNLPVNDFRKYLIYRKPAGESEWTALEELTNITQVLYYDYTAANAVANDYKITVFEIVPGDVDLESGDSDIGSGTLDTDSWFIIGADRTLAHIFEVPVVGAPFTEPVQQEIFEPLGTSRKVIIRGKVMGAEGSLQCKWNTSEREVALEQIAYIKSVAGPHILKSPFGDVWIVEFSGPTKDYESGGHLNAVLTWTEVA